MEQHLNTKKRLIDQISAWIKFYSDRANVKTLVVGVSGGIDSALVSYLCAMTKMPTVLVSAPIWTLSVEQLKNVAEYKSKNRYFPGQGLKQTRDAKDHMKMLSDKFSNVKTIELDLNESFFHFDKILREAGYDSDLGFANSKSRMRMTALYQIATSNGGIVVGTGNKVEDFGVGFFTKYGDGGVDISPIADLTKTQVRELAAELGISKAILDAAPTDGLWLDDRTDEQQIGATYPELEWAMKHIEDNPFGETKDENLTDREQEVLCIYETFHRKNLHKMNPVPFFKIEKTLVNE